MGSGSSATKAPRLIERPAARWLSVFAGAVILALAVLLPSRAPETASVSINRHALDLAVARTPDEHRRGLSGLDRLPEDGMLFLFDGPEPRAFWMRGMRFPIDIVWVRGDTIVGVTPNLRPPPTGTPDEKLERFASPEPVDRVIELAAGRAAMLGIAPGQRVNILLP